MRTILLGSILCLCLAPGHVAPAADRRSPCDSPHWYTQVIGDPVGPDRATPPVTTVEGVALETTLRGASLHRTAAPPDRIEGFDLNGTWMRGGSRVPADGTYAIEQSRFCVVTAGRRTCRQLLRDATGAYFTRASPADRCTVKVDITHR